ncbi:MAG: hypothetical protein IRY99_08115 [Isosphaeraceae bacterium]|nr:hypothetical protein [Isosphaeraceae bacterium]
MMHRRGTLPILMIYLVMSNDVFADGWQKLHSRGAEVYYADEDLRKAFAEANPGALPEAKLKLPQATAPAFDWTKLIKAGHVHAQQGSICCWAYAVVSAFEWNWAIRNGSLKLPDLALQPILDRVQKDGIGYAGWGLEDLLEHGTCPAKSYRHVGKPARLRPGVKMPYRAVAWGMVAPPGGMPAVEQIKQALLDHGPLVANVYLTPAFKAYRGGIFAEHAKPPAGAPPTGHIVVIVGWDDRKGKEGCWKVQNSWGPRWGEGGFMWIEYGSNNIGHSACWVRAQSTFYDLPEGIHEEISPEADPFPHWPDAKEVDLPSPTDAPILTPTEALKRQGEQVVVQFPVKGGAINSFEGHVELFSEASWRDERCLIVRILKDDLAQFPAKSPRALLDRYRGKEIRVRGSVQTNPINIGNRPIIEVDDPDQIEMTK